MDGEQAGTELELKFAPPLRNGEPWPDVVLSDFPIMVTASYQHPMQSEAVEQNAKAPILTIEGARWAIIKDDGKTAVVTCDDWDKRGVYWELITQPVPILDGLTPLPIPGAEVITTRQELEDAVAWHGGKMLAWAQENRGSDEKAKAIMTAREQQQRPMEPTHEQLMEEVVHDCDQLIEQGPWGVTNKGLIFTHQLFIRRMLPETIPDDWLVAQLESTETGTAATAQLAGEDQAQGRAMAKAPDAANDQQEIMAADTSELGSDEGQTGVQNVAATLESALCDETLQTQNDGERAMAHRVDREVLVPVVAAVMPSGSVQDGDSVIPEDPALTDSVEEHPVMAGDTAAAPDRSARPQGIDKAPVAEAGPEGANEQDVTVAMQHDNTTTEQRAPYNQDSRHQQQSPLVRESVADSDNEHEANDGTTSTNTAPQDEAADNLDEAAGADDGSQIRANERELEQMIASFENALHPKKREPREERFLEELPLLAASAPDACICGSGRACACGPTERALRLFEQPTPNTPAMTSQQRQACLHEIDRRALSFDSERYQDVPDNFIAAAVLAAWHEYCFDTTVNHQPIEEVDRERGKWV